MNNRKKVLSIRTCFGCGGKTSKAELVRLALLPSGLVIDMRQVLHGRGVYCCRRVQCFQRAVRQRKRLAWALRYQETQEIGRLINCPELESKFAAVVMFGSIDACNLPAL